MSKIENILQFLDDKEIDYRIESDFCCGYIFYFLDGSVYPRRYYDNALEGIPITVLCESVDHVITRATSTELSKDWKHRIEESTYLKLFDSVELYLIENYKYNSNEKIN